MILLHRNAVEENGIIPQQCLNAARAAVTQVIGQVELKQLLFVDPIMAVSDPIQGLCVRSNCPFSQPLWTIIIRLLIGKR